MNGYTWKVGDVFTDGQYRWTVVRVHGDRAVLEGSSYWVKTNYLTYDEWNGDGRWKLVTP